MTMVLSRSYLIFIVLTSLLEISFMLKCYDDNSYNISDNQYRPLLIDNCHSCMIFIGLLSITTTITTTTTLSMTEKESIVSIDDDDLDYYRNKRFVDYVNENVHISKRITLYPFSSITRSNQQQQQHRYISTRRCIKEEESPIYGYDDKNCFCNTDYCNTNIERCKLEISFKPMFPCYDGLTNSLKIRQKCCSCQIRVIKTTYYGSNLQYQCLTFGQIDIDNNNDSEQQSCTCQKAMCNEDFQTCNHQRQNYSFRKNKRVENLTTSTISYFISNPFWNRWTSIREENYKNKQYEESASTTTTIVPDWQRTTTTTSITSTSTYSLIVNTTSLNTPLETTENMTVMEYMLESTPSDLYNETDGKLMIISLENSTSAIIEQQQPIVEEIVEATTQTVWTTQQTLQDDQIVMDYTNDTDQNMVFEKFNDNNLPYDESIEEVTINNDLFLTNTISNLNSSQQHNVEILDHILPILFNTTTDYSTIINYSNTSDSSLTTFVFRTSQTSSTVKQLIENTFVSVLLKNFTQNFENRLESLNNNKSSISSNDVMQLKGRYSSGYMKICSHLLLFWCVFIFLLV
ncbi:unnamed protein product [Didymodactylos carnosus]|uniref:Uncharacterized protein n=1 Tax=Didymodactylos carnosus TaxID=1234261 RepID=A0A813YAH4_9BILA|nr:unnamed protein product [Didymodactylos carnosus]CAF3667511.1 unnamed protein product [Didymodactylos carnosus]